MPHPRTRLALLISLIGAGASPYAWSRDVEPSLGTVDTSALGAVIDDYTANVLDRLGDPVASVKPANPVHPAAPSEPRAGPSVAAGNAPAVVSKLLRAPAEAIAQPQPTRTARISSSGHEAALDAVRNDYSVAILDRIGEAPIPPRRTAAPRPAPAPVPRAPQVAVADDRSGTSGARPEPGDSPSAAAVAGERRVEPIEPPIAREAVAAPNDSPSVSAPKSALMSSLTTRDAPARASPVSMPAVAEARIEPVLDSIVLTESRPRPGALMHMHSAPLQDSTDTAAVETALAPVRGPLNPINETATSQPLWSQVAPTASPQVSPRPDDREIVVADSSGKVLRTLEAILHGERDEVGAIRADTRETIVATHEEKVLETLARFAAPRDAPEDGPAKRARKLAARLPAAAVQPGLGASPVDIDLTTLDAPDAEPEVALRAVPSEAVRAVVETSQPSQALPTSPDQDPARAAPAHPFGDAVLAISDQVLDGVRGGFVGDGLNISFGIERAVYINGALVTTTSLNVSELGRITASNGTTAIDGGTLALVQSGAGNSVSAGSISAASIGAVVQNTLDGQKIQNVTLINASANSVGALRGLNLESSLRGAVIDSLRR